MSLIANFHSVRIIADDLTGACDTAVAFACAGMVTEVETSWHIRTPVEAQVIAWNTESRDIGALSAVQRIEEAAARLADDAAHHVYKKVDSVFRGNTFTEIAACLARFPHELAILAPAIPDLGRKMRDGQLLSEDISGSWRQDIFKNLTDVQVHPKKISAAAAIPDAFQRGARVLLCDSETADDLQEIVLSSLPLAHSGRILWIGSGGLARPLASALRTSEAPECPILKGSTVVFLVGSDHPVTLRQLEHLHLSGRDAVVIPIDRGISPGMLRDKLIPYAERGVSCLFATGGDTALAVCQALGINRLRVECEFSRGLPQSRILGGPFDGAHFIMKSGGFGEQDVFSRIAQTFTHAGT